MTIVHCLAETCKWNTDQKCRGPSVELKQVEGDRDNIYLACMMYRPKIFNREGSSGKRRR